MNKFISSIPFWAVEVCFAMGMLLDKNFFFLVAICLGAITAIVSVAMLIAGKISVASMKTRNVLKGILDCSFTVFVGVSCCVAGYVMLGICSFVFGIIQLASQIVEKSATESN